MTIEDQLLSKLHQADLLPTQQKLVQKLEAKPFEFSKKSTYEPLYDLLKTLFITEYPNFKSAKILRRFSLIMMLNTYIAPIGIFKIMA